MYTRSHHQVISHALSYFNVNYLKHHHILFGGGTRIALEIDEFRESVDIDFLCPNKSSYRAVREQVTNKTLGNLVIKDFTYTQDIKFDRNAVRTFIDIEGIQVKLEFVCFDNYDLTADTSPVFSVPFIDRVSCFYTKLLANADRAGEWPYKDIIDLLAMIFKWGEIPEQSKVLARSHYGHSIDNRFAYALKHLVDNQSDYEYQSVNMGIDKLFFQRLVMIAQEQITQK